MVHDESFLLETERRREGETERNNRNVPISVQRSNRQSAVRSEGLDFDYVIEKTIQLIGFISVNELELLTPHEWEQMIKGARHRRLDNIEDMRTQSVMSAHLSGGKKGTSGMKKIDESLKKERKLINQTGTSVEYEKEKDKDFQKRVRAVQRKALQKWLDNKNK